MGLSAPIQAGLANEQVFQVEEAYTAVKVGSGGLPVLATPSLIAFMEQVAFRLLEEHLPEGSSSVGIWVDIRHLAATPVGENVRVHCEVVEAANGRVTFNLQAWDEHEKVGEGKHQRVIIDPVRFMRRVEGKKR